MGKREIIETLAKGRTVEKLIENIAHQPLNAELKDLSQMVYIILLEYDEDRIVELWESNDIQYFLVRIILNQYRSRNSRFYYQIMLYVRQSTDITGKDWIDD